MPIKCVAIDDEPPALALLKEYIAVFPELQLLQTFDDAISAAGFLRSIPVDLLFIDINMPDISGTDLVRSLEKKPLVIFTTAYKKFAWEGFELEAFDYLLKPIDRKRFTRSVQKAIDYFNYKNNRPNEQDDSIFVHSEYKLVKVSLQDVEYIESLEDYIRIHLLSAKPILTLMPLKKMLEKLPGDKFRRIHRSYIVAVDKVVAIANRKVKLVTNRELPVSDTYTAFIQDWKK
ncbi:MAG TPA: LytTR family DNA-binding domain-containing protein [Chitinophagaceae bacterium]|jgi:DNA-binding LytR/AlgR family response regulator